MESSDTDLQIAPNALQPLQVVIIGGLLQENPFYVEPDPVLREIRAQRRRSVGTPSRTSARA